MLDSLSANAVFSNEYHLFNREAFAVQEGFIQTDQAFADKLAIQLEKSLIKELNQQYSFFFFVLCHRCGSSILNLEGRAELAESPSLVNLE